MAKRKSRFTKKELIDVRASLPSTWIKDLADKSGLAEGSVKNILYGLAVNDEVVLSAVELAIAHKAVISEKKDLISNL